MIDRSDATLDRTFSALAHPIRRALLGRLARGGTLSVTELAEPFDVSLMAISKHLRVMEEAELIRRRKDGRVQRCSYEPAGMDQARDWIEVHRRYWERQLDSLAAYLESPETGAEGHEGSEEPRHEQGEG